MHDCDVVLWRFDRVTLHVHSRQSYRGVSGYEAGEILKAIYHADIKASIYSYMLFDADWVMVCMDAWFPIKKRANAPHWLPSCGYTCTDCAEKEIIIAAVH